MVLGAVVDVPARGTLPVVVVVVGAGVPNKLVLGASGWVVGCVVG